MEACDIIQSLSKCCKTGQSIDTECHVSNGRFSCMGC